jgi:hypothetical protein
MNDTRIVAAALTVARPLTPPSAESDREVILGDYRWFLGALNQEKDDDLPDAAKKAIEEVNQRRKNRSA